MYTVCYCKIFFFNNNTPKACFIETLQSKLIFPMEDISRTYSTEPDVSFCLNKLLDKNSKGKGSMQNVIFWRKPKTVSEAQNATH